MYLGFRFRFVWFIGLMFFCYLVLSVFFNGCSMPNGVKGTVTDRINTLKTDAVATADEQLNITNAKLENQIWWRKYEANEKDIKLLKDAIESVRTGRYTIAQWRDFLKHRYDEAFRVLTKHEAEAKNLIVYLEQVSKNPGKNVTINGVSYSAPELNKMAVSKERSLLDLKERAGSYQKQLSYCEKTYDILKTKAEDFKTAVEKAETNQSFAMQKHQILVVTNNTTESGGFNAGDQAIERLEKNDVNPVLDAKMESASEKIQERMGDSVPDMLSPEQHAASLKAMLQQK